MTVKVVVLYGQPADPAAFDEHYFNVHLPLCAKIPGLERTETAKLVAALDGGEASFYRLTELYFPDADTMGAAMGGPEGQATNADFAAIAPEGTRLYMADVN
jgi:uncharacterized protein (TIGR02118 family)